MEEHIMEMATNAAAQAWCTEKTSGIEMDVRLAEAFRDVLAHWIDTAALFSRNADYYRGLLDEMASHLGKEVYIADDGSVSEEPLRAKIPEMVKVLVTQP